MLMRRIIPCLDVHGDRVVKGVRFSNLRDAGDPVELSALYESDGADEIVVLDVSATPEQRATAVETVRSIRRALRIPLLVGGGVRAVDDATRLLDAGADKVAVNTAAVRRPVLLHELTARFGRQCLVLSIDAARRSDDSGWEVVVQSGAERTGIDAVEWARHCTAADAAGEILLTSWDRDGTQDGYDLDLLRAVCGATDVPVIASGGASTARHMLDALRCGATAVLAASIFHNGSTDIRSVKQFLKQQRMEVRT